MVVSCGGEVLKNFLDRTGRNAIYTSDVAVVEFIEALGILVEESLLKQFHQASYFSIITDECTDVRGDVGVLVLSMGGRCGTRGAFFGNSPSKKPDTESIYFALVKYLKEKQLEVSRIIGMGFDGASTFSGNKPESIQGLRR